MKKRILYGVANYEELVRDNGYFVDKTHYLEKLERVKDPVFLRPRRFGKSLWCRMMGCYYNVNQQDDFDRLFDHTYIGQNPTLLVEKFNMGQFFEPAYFPISFFYLGMLTRQDDFYLRLPNLNMRQIFIQ
ncbi:MAG: AAA family ATPase [Anaerolineales bacterium]